jgi:hypothetical protein
MVFAAALVAGCGNKGDERPGAVEAPAPAAPAAEPAAPEPAPPPACTVQTPPLRVPAAERIVAIGDLHGDLAATRRALRLAGAIDEADRWAGGELVVVQTGDLLDRGDDEQAMIELFERLAVEAAEAGGAVHVLHGNHELMNVAGDLRYVTPGGFRDFADAPGVEVGPELDSVPELARHRVAAFAPGGPYARILADNPTVLIVGDTVFAHGGVVPAFAAGLEELNREVACWLTGAGPAPAAVRADDGPLWSRHYSTEPPRCQLLARTLDELGARRMVVAHTRQVQGINAACDDRVWRIDVGMAAHYGGPTQVLELRGDRARVLE